MYGVERGKSETHHHVVRQPASACWIVSSTRVISTLSNVLGPSIVISTPMSVPMSIVSVAIATVYIWSIDVVAQCSIRVSSIYVWHQSSGPICSSVSQGSISVGPVPMDTRRLILENHILRGCVGSSCPRGSAHLVGRGWNARMRLVWTERSTKWLTTS